ncbi:MAG TPA: aldo/keto reductase [Mycobacteriales bacterium]|nr:aldo/keto reductase [Mycobacteriales bacterium]
MNLRPLGRTGVRVAPLALGCMNFGGRADEATATGILDRALDAGVTLVDTADVYGHDPADMMVGQGRSEEILGRALERGGRRGRVVLATKAFFPTSGDPNDQGSSRRHLITACEASLRRLRVDHIDLFQLHHPSNDVPIDETLRALDDLVRAGKVRYLGTSAFGAWQIVESLWASATLGLHRFVTEQPPYHLLDRRAERELVPMARSHGIAVLPWSPTAGGFLTGRYRRGQPPPAGSRFDTFWAGGRDEQFTDPAFDVLDVVVALAAEKGCTPAQLALAWCAAQPGITAPIIGPRTLEQLEDSLGALDVTITADDTARIDAVAPPGRATVPYYGADGFAWTTWGPHTHHWP